jgi:ankyrin repeat protein
MAVVMGTVHNLRLLAARAGVGAVSLLSCDALSVAVHLEHQDMAMYLLEQGLVPSPQDLATATQATMNGFVLKAMEERVAPHTMGPALERACSMPNRTVVEAILRHAGGCIPPSCDHDALITGAFRTRDVVVWALLQAAGCHTSPGARVFVHAMDGSHIALRHTLTHHRANIQPRHLDAALAVTKQCGIAAELLHHGADVHSQNDMVLFEACVRGDHDMVGMLLAHGADPGARNYACLKEACAGGRVHVVARLLHHLQTHGTWPPHAIGGTLGECLVSVLCNASSRSNTLIHTLIQNGADPTIHQGLPLLLALQGSSLATVTAILQGPPPHEGGVITPAHLAAAASRSHVDAHRALDALLASGATWRPPHPDTLKAALLRCIQDDNPSATALLLSRIPDTTLASIPWDTMCLEWAGREEQCCTMLAATAAFGVVSQLHSVSCNCTAHATRKWCTAAATPTC